MQKNTKGYINIFFAMEKIVDFNIKIDYNKFFIIMKNFVDSLNNDFTISMIKIIISILLLIFFDIIIQSNFICFSKNILYELGYLTTYAIIVAIYYYFKVIRGGKEW